MNGFAICAIAILVLTAAALLALARLRKGHAEKRVGIAIVNDGNVPSRYELRAEDPGSALEFRVNLLDGEATTLTAGELPVGPARPGETASARGAAGGVPAKPSEEATGARRGCQPILRTAGVVADGLVSIGQLLPRSVRGPVMQLASRMRGGQMAAMRVQRVPTQAARLKSSRLRPTAAHKAAVAKPEASGPTWLMTPSVAPGQTLALELQIRALRMEAGARRQFRVLSRSVDAAEPTIVTKEGIAGFSSSFWTRRWLPFISIATVAIVLLLIAFGLATSGLLG